MLKNLFATILLILVTTTTCFALDVTVKGIDNGINEGKSIDYDQAVMNAKLQAIERAGVSIESATSVRNGRLDKEWIESHARASINPGFRLLDIGYQADGTYQVVLIGSIRVNGGSGAGSSNGKTIGGRFVKYDNGITYDKKLHVYWQSIAWSENNGKKATWQDVRREISRMNSLAPNGLRNWRLPTYPEVSKTTDKDQWMLADQGAFDYSDVDGFFTSTSKKFYIDRQQQKIKGYSYYIYLEPGQWRNRWVSENGKTILQYADYFRYNGKTCYKEENSTFHGDIRLVCDKQ